MIQASQGVLPGSKEAPGFYFHGPIGCGWFYDSANSRVVSVINGVPVAYIDATGLTAAGVTIGLTDIPGTVDLTSGLTMSFPWTGGIPAPLAVVGTDAVPANGTTFVSEIIIPHALTITGISYLIGSVGGTDKVYAAIWNAAGTFLQSSVLTAGGATVGTAATMQPLDLIAPITVTGPARYFVGIAMNGGTARLRTHLLGRHYANSIAMTHGTIVALVPGTLFSTIFTASKGPFATIY